MVPGYPWGCVSTVCWTWGLLLYEWEEPVQAISASGAPEGFFFRGVDVAGPGKSGVWVLRAQGLWIKRTEARQCCRASAGGFHFFSRVFGLVLVYLFLSVSNSCTSWQGIELARLGFILLSVVLCCSVSHKWKLPIIPWMQLLKITDFFETDLLHNFYSINDKDMSIGS